MKSLQFLSPSVLILGFMIVGCSGMGTKMAKVNRLRQNRGYEINADMSLVQAATLDVLKARGYEVSLKADPENGAEGAGQIVIGQRVTKYNAVVGSASTGAEAPTQMDTRDLVDVYVSKKWHLSSDQAVPNLTLVDIVGGSYLRKGAGAAEVETPLTPATITLIREEIERAAHVTPATPSPSK